MDWKELGNIVAPFAPKLGLALGGPMGAAVGVGLASFLGSSDKTPESVSERLSADSKAIDRLKEFELRELQIEASALETMLKAESNSKHTSRPWIAKGCFLLLAKVTVAVVTILLWGVYKSDDPLESLKGSWQLVASLLFPFTILLQQYFGVLRKESQDRIVGAGGGIVPSLLGSILGGKK